MKKAVRENFELVSDPYALKRFKEQVFVELQPFLNLKGSDLTRLSALSSAGNRIAQNIRSNTEPESCLNEFRTDVCPPLINTAIWTSYIEPDCWAGFGTK